MSDTFKVKVGDKVRDKVAGDDFVGTTWVEVTVVSDDDGTFSVAGDRDFAGKGTWIPMFDDFDHMPAIPSVVETTESILDKAAAACTGARQSDYGTPLVNHSRTAKLFTAYLGIEVDANMVCDLNILQKISRGMNEVTEDTCVDIAGYAWNKFEVNR